MSKNYIKELIDSLDPSKNKTNHPESYVPLLDSKMCPSKPYDISQAATVWLDKVLSDLPLIREPL